MHRVDYLHRLGISHVYASPLLAAAPHSQHGYDICDFQRLNPELGTEKDLELLAQQLHARKMGLLLDIVPNHMCVGSSRNAWWWDVLACGRASRFANFFDIDWDPPDPGHRGRIILPMLADRYHRSLSNGELRLAFENGTFVVRYFDNVFPVSGVTSNELWKSIEIPGFRLPESQLAEVGHINGKVERDSEVKRWSDESVELTQARTGAARDLVNKINGDLEHLNAILDQQFYRLTYWRHGDTLLNYRRFFSISSLAGLRIEREEVFARTHALPLLWLERGWIDGFRIDHPDGLWSPTGYLQRLRREAPKAWIIVEKILIGDEQLSPHWPVDGTTGYDFLNQASGFFVEPKAAARLGRFHRKLTGEESNFHAVSCDSKRWVLRQMLESETGRLTHLVEQIALEDWKWCDFTATEIKEALIEVLAYFPVYRTYLDDTRLKCELDGEPDDNFRYIRQAIVAAKASRRDLDPSLFGLLETLLLGGLRDDRADVFVARFQQLAAATMAKGVEDTAFYRFNRLVSLNEVGGNPGRFGSSVLDFHTFCQRMGTRFPRSLLATSTHDTKRSEDARMRIAALSAIPQAWEQFVRRISLHNERHKLCGLPDRNTEYLFYQTLIGTWPIAVDRVTAYMEKAAREASVHTNWRAPEFEYESCLRRFVEAVLGDAVFLRLFESFVNPLASAALTNSLALVLLKATAPGIPDFYQGTEFWSFDLVDPDNRRLVDFGAREAALGKVANFLPGEVLIDAGTGLIKMWMIKEVLTLRKDNPETFDGCARYDPIHAKGTRNGNLIAFMRNHRAITLVPRLMGPGDTWKNETVVLPEGKWKHWFTGEYFRGGRLKISQLFQRFPVALLWKINRHP